MDARFSNQLMSFYKSKGKFRIIVFIFAAILIVFCLYVYIPRHIYFELPIYDYNPDTHEFSGKDAMLTVDIYKCHHIFNDISFFGTITIDDEVYTVNFSSAVIKNGLPGFMNQTNFSLEMHGEHNYGVIFFSFALNPPVVNHLTGEQENAQIDILIYNMSPSEAFELTHKYHIETESILLQYQKGYLSSVDQKTLARMRG